LKSTPRIFVDVDGMAMEGLRTAVAAVAASPSFVVSLICGFPCSSNGVEPFGREVLLDMEVVIVPEIATQKFPTFLGGTCTQPMSGLGFKAPLIFPCENSIDVTHEAIPTKVDPMSATMGSNADICATSST